MDCIVVAPLVRDGKGGYYYLSVATTLVSHFKCIGFRYHGVALTFSMVYHFIIPETPFPAGSSDDAAVKPRNADGSDLQVDLPGDYGVTCDFLPDDLAPPVAIDLLERLARNELPAEQSESAIRLLNMFRPWREAFTQIVQAKVAAMTKRHAQDLRAQLDHGD